MMTLAIIIVILIGLPIALIIVGNIVAMICVGLVHLVLWRPTVTAWTLLLLMLAGLCAGLSSRGLL